MTQLNEKAAEVVTAEIMIERARALVPLIREKAREAEIARRPLDEVIDAVRDSGLFALMVPKAYGGYEMDVDTFFEVVLILSEADASMGWLIAFYIDHAYWIFNFPESVTREVHKNDNYVLASAALNASAGIAKKVDGGYRLSGRWQWGTGIVHATWMMAGGVVDDGSGNVQPLLFMLPREEVQEIDNWFIDGMCATGSLDFEVNNVFIAEDRALSFIDLLHMKTDLSSRYPAPVYKTPLMGILAFSGALPCLGAAKMALRAHQEQAVEKIKNKYQRAGGVSSDGKEIRIAKAALNIEAAEIYLRSVLADVIEKRESASREDRAQWLARVAHGVFMCREAVQDIVSASGASCHFLDNPIQRALRDINTATGHVQFDFETRYRDFGLIMYGQPVSTLMV